MTATGPLRATERSRAAPFHAGGTAQVHEGLRWDEWGLVAVVEVAGARTRSRPDSGEWGALELADRAFRAEAVLSGFVPEPCGLRVLWWCSAHKARFMDAFDDDG